MHQSVNVLKEQLGNEMQQLEIDRKQGWIRARAVFVAIVAVSIVVFYALNRDHLKVLFFVCGIIIALSLSMLIFRCICFMG